MSDANPQSTDQAGDVPAPTYQPTPAGSAPAFKPIQLVQGTIVGIDVHHYTVSVRTHGEDAWSEGVPYNPLAYIPRLDEEVWVAFRPGPEPGHVGLMWVLGVESRRMFGSPTFGRPPTAALWSDTSQIIGSGVQNLEGVEMDHKAWDTDNMLIELGDGQKTTKITPQRTGVYTVKAGGRWDKDRRLQGRRGMDLRWADDGGIIARDEKAPNSEGECGHSVSADIRITTSIDPAHASPWVRYLGAAVELVVYQTSGQSLRLMSDHVSKPFLQMTYQGPMP
jgi:hypothetical protein